MQYKKVTIGISDTVQCTRGRHVWLQWTAGSENSVQLPNRNDSCGACNARGLSQPTV